MLHLLFKLGRRIVVGMLLVGLISVGLVVSQAAPHSDASPLVAALEVTNPQVSYRADAQNDWQPLESERTVLATGNQITTDANGKAIVTWFEDGTFMEIGPNTEMAFDEITMAEDGDSFTIDMALLKGRLIQSVDRLVDEDSTYRISRGNLTVSVRGTVFAVDVDSQGVVSIAASEGTLDVVREVLPDDDVDHILEEYQVNQGQMLLIAPDGSITEISLQAALADSDPLAQALADFEERLATLEDSTDTEIDLLDSEQENSTSLLDDTVEETKETLNDTVDDTQETLNDTVDNTREALNDTVDDTQDALNDTVEETEEVLDGLGGGLFGADDTGSLLGTAITAGEKTTTQALLDRTRYLFSSLSG